ncbi:MAG: hypothetical protein M3014_01180 [Chloroflexota bacterium]|nr:hypothetical protein [Chloroflexota bacterium]
MKRRVYPTQHQLPLPGFDEVLILFEWEIAQAVVQSSLAQEPGAWQAFQTCSAVEIYTDGSAPVRNPGGPAGFAAVVVGFEQPVSSTSSTRPAPSARLDLGGYIPARKSEPFTSNNRAEIAGVLAACQALYHLGSNGCSAKHVQIWSDSQYVIYCATGKWQRKKNTDLWPALDRISGQANDVLAKPFSLQWVRGHAGNQYNEAADELASRAAFNFDGKIYDRFRAAQAATGREMPGEKALAQIGLPVAPSAGDESAPGTNDWLKGADYTLALRTKQSSVHRTSSSGSYIIWNKEGNKRAYSVKHAGEHGQDEAEYMTLAAAMTQLQEILTLTDRLPSDHTVTIYSCKELMVKQLKGEYRVKAPALQYLYAEVSALLKSFKQAELIWKQSPQIDNMFKA